MTVFKTVLRLIKRNFVYALFSLFSILFLLPFISEKSGTINGYKFDVAYNGNIENATKSEKSLIRYLKKYNIESQNYTDEEIETVNALNIYNLMLNLNEKNSEKKLKISSRVLSLEVRQFLSLLDYYGNYEKAEKMMNVSVNTKIIGNTASSKQKVVNSFLMYQISLFIMTMSGQVFGEFYKKRIEHSKIISSISSKKYLLQMLSGMTVLLVIAVMIVMLLSMIFVRYTVNSLLYSFINLFIFGISILTMSSLIRRISKTPQVSIGIANMVTLVLGFISGSFIPVKFINPEFLKFSKLFPEYYAVQNVYNGTFNTLFMKNSFIILLFAVIYFIVSILLFGKRALRSL